MPKCDNKVFLHRELTPKEKGIVFVFLPGVPPSRDALAPVSCRRPPSFRCLDARLAAMTEDHTLCLNIRSEFLTSAVCKDFKITSSLKTFQNSLTPNYQFSVCTG